MKMNQLNVHLFLAWWASLREPVGPGRVRQGLAPSPFASNAMRSLPRSLLGLALLLAPAVWAQTGLGTYQLTEGPAAGSDSVVLMATNSWVAQAGGSWLYLPTTNYSGTGNRNLIFNFTANHGATRTSTLLIAGQTLTVTQAGATYSAANPLTALLASGLNAPSAVALDGAGNVYIADTGNNAIKKWTVANGPVSTLVSSGLLRPNGVAVDGAGNVYIADTGNNVIKKRAASSAISTLVQTPQVAGPCGVALDSVTNVYIADTGDNAIKEVLVQLYGSVSTLVAPYLNPAYQVKVPSAVAVDGPGNVYIADTGDNAIKELIAANNATKALTTLVSSGLAQPDGVAVDGGGNVYIADSAHNAIKKWTAASGVLTTLVSSGLAQPYGLAVDGAGNVYIADSGNNAIKELPRAFVDATTKTEPASAGSDVLPAVLPLAENLSGPFAPTSDAAWLTLGAVVNGVVSFSFTANNSSSSRTAHITLLGQSIAVTQAAMAVTPPVLSGWQKTANGGPSFVFTNNQGASFTVLSTTNPGLPLTNWAVVGTPSNNGSGRFQFTAPAPTNDPQRYYRVRSP